MIYMSTYILLIMPEMYIEIIPLTSTDVKAAIKIYPQWRPAHFNTTCIISLKWWISNVKKWYFLDDILT